MDCRTYFCCLAEPLTSFIHVYVIFLLLFGEQFETQMKPQKLSLGWDQWDTCTRTVNRIVGLRWIPSRPPGRRFSGAVSLVCQGLSHLFQPGCIERCSERRINFFICFQCSLSKTCFDVFLLTLMNLSSFRHVLWCALIHPSGECKFIQNSNSSPIISFHRTSAHLWLVAYLIGCIIHSRFSPNSHFSIFQNFVPQPSPWSTLWT